MKCAACGYEHRLESKWVDDVVRYKSGPKKGEIKSVSKKEIVFEVGTMPFMPLRFAKEVDQLVYDDDRRERMANLFACPKCGTIRMDVVGESIDDLRFD